MYAFPVNGVTHLWLANISSLSLPAHAHRKEFAHTALAKDGALESAHHSLLFFMHMEVHT
jgi:hypothetical protein